MTVNYLHMLLVGLGGGVGSICRYLVGVGALRLMGPSFPWGTLTVNIVGSFLIGVIVELLALRVSASAEWRLLLITGFLGGFTTFSAFSLDAFSLYQRGDVLSAASYVAASLVLSLLAVAFGVFAMRTVL